MYEGSSVSGRQSKPSDHWYLHQLRDEVTERRVNMLACERLMMAVLGQVSSIGMIIVIITVFLAVDKYQDVKVQSYIIIVLHALMATVEFVTSIALLINMQAIKVILKYLNAFICAIFVSSLISLAICTVYLLFYIQNNLGQILAGINGVLWALQLYFVILAKRTKRKIEA